MPEISQFPLRLAWALTVHKMQGKTVKNPQPVVADISTVFYCNPTYVFLSPSVNVSKHTRLLSLFLSTLSLPSFSLSPSLSHSLSHSLLLYLSHSLFLILSLSFSFSFSLAISFFLPLSLSLSLALFLSDFPIRFQRSHNSDADAKTNASEKLKTT
jgi:hypothetical protein